MCGRTEVNRASEWNDKKNIIGEMRGICCARDSFCAGYVVHHRDQSKRNQSKFPPSDMTAVEKGEIKQDTKNNVAGTNELKL